MPGRSAAASTTRSVDRFEVDRRRQAREAARAARALARALELIGEIAEHELEASVSLAEHAVDVVRGRLAAAQADEEDHDDDR